ncbi:MAG: TetR/AcrR family transcriptional regulator [Hydrocarboniphaga sp.]|uniref:TetR/AcrR family transcriptional regulator n=1 Tax=Hydrocarboniphaga sp. TaxID=2033016 RepID=UPI00261F5A3F|nr:helix-turn-helix domain-containing protein [Hydrocarboniphaga sp.]MDB5968339.1 TetR/AcrR family transcriptional regulator [Hydrocarboniphaga sp.]
MSKLIVNKEIALTVKSAATRARLIATAERMFAERGIEGVTLNDINLAAGQRNKNATHYHFGDKRGLLQAIIDKHLPAIVLRRNQLLEASRAQGGYTAATVVGTLLYPLAEKLFDGNGGRDFIRINAQLAAAHAAAINGATEAVFQIGPIDWLNAARAEFMHHLPEPIAQQRVTLAVALILNGLADHSRLLDRAPADPATDTELFIRNLEDCLVALCTAPASAAAVAALKKAEQQRAPAAARAARKKPVRA